MMPACIHGQLTQPCHVCERDQKDAVIMSLEGTVARLTAENARLRRVVELVRSAPKLTKKVNMTDGGFGIFFVYELHAIEIDPALAALDAKEGA